MQFDDAYDYVYSFAIGAKLNSRSSTATQCLYQLWLMLRESNFTYNYLINNGTYLENF